MFGLGLGLGLGSRGGGVRGPRILLSSATIADSASVGDTVGTLSVSGGTGSETFSISSDPSNQFSISGSLFKVAASLTAGSYAVTLATNTGLTRAFLITVTHEAGGSPDVPSAATLTITSTSEREGTGLAHIKCATGTVSAQIECEVAKSFTVFLL